MYVHTVLQWMSLSNVDIKDRPSVDIPYVSSCTKIKNANFRTQCAESGQQDTVLHNCHSVRVYPVSSFPLVLQNISYWSRPDLFVQAIVMDVCYGIHLQYVDMWLQLMTASAVFLWSDSSKTTHSIHRTSGCYVIATMVTHTICKIFRQKRVLQ